MRNNTHTKGFMALMSIIIISFVLLGAVITLGLRGITGRFVLLDLLYKQMSESYANACVEVARIAILNDAAYTTTNQEVVIDADTDATCTLVSVASGPSAGESTIRARAEEKNATTNYEVVVDADTLNVISWREVGSF